MGPGVALSGAEKQAELLRKDGNHYFQKGRIGAAIEAYTEAITLCPTVPVYLTNRALCHRKRNDWKKVEEDCRKAIQLDSNSVKAHYMLGLALIQNKVYPEGIKHLEKRCIMCGSISECAGHLFMHCPFASRFWSHMLEAFGWSHPFPNVAFDLLSSVLVGHSFRGHKKALDLGRGANPKSYIVEEIWQELAKAKYRQWEKASTERSWELQSLKEACEAALEQKYFLDQSELEGFVDEAEIFHRKQLKSLRSVFQKVAEADAPSEVPDYLCCKITLDILRDPVITPSGVTYERAVILDHFQKVGNFDPITRELLNESQLVPNLAVKEAVQAFLDKHGWAYNTD